MHWTRRNFITAAPVAVAAVSGSLSAFSGSLPRVTSSGAGLTVTGTDPRDITYFSSNFRSLMHLAVPTSFHVHGSGKSALRCAVVFDERLLSFGDVVIVQSDGETQGMELKAFTSGRRRSGVTFTVPPSLARTSDLLITLPTRFRDLYPVDHLSAVIPLTLTVTAGTARVTAVSDPVVASANVRPWALVPELQWAEQVGTSGLRGYFPRTLTVHNVGPFPSPPGTKIVLAADARFVKNFGDFTATLDPATFGTGDAEKPKTYRTRISESEGRRLLELSLDQELAVKESLLVYFAPDLDVKDASLDWAPTSVDVLPPAGASIRRPVPGAASTRPFVRTEA